MSDAITLGEALPKEMARVRDEVMPAYLEIGIPGVIAWTLMRDSLDQATRAMASGDVVEMLKTYQDLKGYRT